MTDHFFNKAFSELNEAVTSKDHPFRYFTLGTTGINGTPRLRTVVLRKINKDFVITIYTDKRSRKVTHIKEHNSVCMLFYNPKELLQLKMEGVAYLEEDKKKIEKIWSGIAQNSKRDYITAIGPGTKIENPDAIEYLNETNHFAVMHIKVFKLEYLQLKRPNHLRIEFNRQDSASWKSSFMIP